MSPKKSFIQINIKYVLYKLPIREAELKWSEDDVNLKELVFRSTIDMENFAQESSKIKLLDRNPNPMITLKQKPKVY